MKKFLFKLTVFGLVFVMLASGYVFLLIQNNAATFQLLVDFQKQKIKQQTGITTLFIGDSSLGHSIDSKKYDQLSGEKSINCALTGLFGYAGSYNMLKFALKNQAKLKKVVLMQTLDLQLRPVAYDGYLRTISSIDDFSELSLIEKKKVLVEFFYFIKSIDLWQSKEEDLFVNDYVKQDNKLIDKHKIIPFDSEKIISDKHHFLQKIIDLCETNNLQLVYLHGPLFENQVEVSRDYIQAVNLKLQNLDLDFKKEIIKIPEAELGDRDDHVHPDFKQKYTEIYFQLLNNRLDK